METYLGTTSSGRSCLRPGRLGVALVYSYAGPRYRRSHEGWDRTGQEKAKACAQAWGLRLGGWTCFFVCVYVCVCLLSGEKGGCCFGFLALLVGHVLLLLDRGSGSGPGGT